MKIMVVVCSSSFEFILHYNTFIYRFRCTSTARIYTIWRHTQIIIIMIKKNNKIYENTTHELIYSKTKKKLCWEKSIFFYSPLARWFHFHTCDPYMFACMCELWFILFVVRRRHLFNIIRTKWEKGKQEHSYSHTH